MRRVFFFCWFILLIFCVAICQGKQGKGSEKANPKLVFTLNAAWPGGETVPGRCIPIIAIDLTAFKDSFDLKKLSLGVYSGNPERPAQRFLSNLVFYDRKYCRVSDAQDLSRAGKADFAFDFRLNEGQTTTLLLRADLAIQPGESFWIMVRHAKALNTRGRNAKIAGLPINSFLLHF